MHDEPQEPKQEPVEPRAARVRRHRQRGGLYAWAFATVALLVVVIALAVANAHRVKVSWVFGSGQASLVWLVGAAAVLGWLLGIVTSIVFRLRTRRRRAT